MWPMMLDYTRDECVRFLRELELKAYEQIVTAFRAQGNLTPVKRQLLNDLRDYLSISIERHQAEIRRVTNDEKLTTIAHFLSGSEDTACEWQEEGKRLIPLLPRLVPQTAFFEMATTVAAAQFKSNERMPPPAATSRKRDVNEPVPVVGKKMKKESITVRRKVIPSSPTPITLSPIANNANNRRQSQQMKQQPQSKRQSILSEKSASGNRTPVTRVPVPAPAAGSSSTTGRVIFVQSLNQQQQDLSGQIRVSNPSGIISNNSSLSSQSVQQLKQFKSGQPVILLSANSLQRLASCPPPPHSAPSSSLSSAPSSSNVSPSLSMTRSNHTTAQVIYQTAKNANTGKTNLILLPGKGNGGPVFSPSTTNNPGHSSNGIVINHNNHHNSPSSCSNANSNNSSLRSQVVTLPSDMNNRSQTASVTVVRDKRQAADRRRSEVNGSGAVRTEETMNLVVKAAGLSCNHLPGSVSNAQRSANVIEIQASGEVLESLKRKGQLSQDIIALVQKAVSMANGSSANHRPPLPESQTTVPHLPNPSAQTVISSVVPQCEEQTCDSGSVVDP